MQVADIVARNVPELCVKTLRRSGSPRTTDTNVRGLETLKQKTRKQPHAQYKSLKNIVWHGANATSADV